MTFLPCLAVVVSALISSVSSCCKTLSIATLDIYTEKGPLEDVAILFLAACKWSTLLWPCM